MFRRPLYCFTPQFLHSSPPFGFPVFTLWVLAFELVSNFDIRISGFPHGPLCPFAPLLLSPSPKTAQDRPGPLRPSTKPPPEDRLRPPMTGQDRHFKIRGPGPINHPRPKPDPDMHEAEHQLLSDRSGTQRATIPRKHPSPRQAGGAMPSPMATCPGRRLAFRSRLADNVIAGEDCVDRAGGLTCR